MRHDRVFVNAPAPVQGLLSRTAITRLLGVGLLERVDVVCDIVEVNR